MKRKYVPSIGKEFPIDEAIVERRRYTKEAARSAIAICVVFAATLALLASSIQGMWAGDFDGLRAIWSALSLPLGVVLGYYFRGRRGGQGCDDKED